METIWVTRDFRTVNLTFRSCMLSWWTSYTHIRHVRSRIHDMMCFVNIVHTSDMHGPVYTTWCFCEHRPHIRHARSRIHDMMCFVNIVQTSGSIVWTSYTNQACTVLYTRHDVVHNHTRLGGRVKGICTRSKSFLIYTQTRNDLKVLLTIYPMWVHKSILSFVTAKSRIFLVATMLGSINFNGKKQSVPVWRHYQKKCAIS
jgi:hypothetical protein